MVEPNLILASTLQEFLSALGHQVTRLSDCVQLGRLSRDVRRDMQLVIAAVPDREPAARAVLAAIAGFCPDTHILAVSSRPPTARFASEWDAAMLGFLTAPVHLAQLESILMQLTTSATGHAALVLEFPADAKPRSWARREYLRPNRVGHLVPVSPPPRRSGTASSVALV